MQGVQKLAKLQDGLASNVSATIGVQMPLCSWFELATSTYMHGSTSLDVHRTATLAREV